MGTHAPKAGAALLAWRPLLLRAATAASVALELQRVGAHAVPGDDQDLHVVALQGMQLNIAFSQALTRRQW